MHLAPGLVKPSNGDSFSKITLKNLLKHNMLFKANYIYLDNHVSCTIDLKLLVIYNNLLNALLCRNK